MSVRYGARLIHFNTMSVRHGARLKETLLYGPCMCRIESLGSVPCASLWLRWSKLHTSSLTRSDVTIKFHDIPLVCVDGANFFAHKVVLYSASFNLKTLFKYSKCLQELILSSWWRPWQSLYLSGPWVERPPSASPPAGDSPPWDLPALLVSIFYIFTCIWDLESPKPV